MIFCGQLSARTKIACIGNSITFGSGIVNRDHNSYPAQLQAYLGDEYEVVNFGVSGRTLLNKGDRPYTLTDEYARSLAFNPDIVLIKLGTNDSKPRNMQHLADFDADYKALIDSYKALESHPRIILLTPVKCYTPTVYDIDSVAVSGSIVPAVKKAAVDNGVELLDLQNVFGERWEQHLMPDKVHPSSIGAGMVAEVIGRYLLRGTADAAGVVRENACIHAVPGNEYRQAAGWNEGNDWHTVADDIQLTLDGRKLDLLLLGNSITQGWGGTRKAVAYKPGKDVMDGMAGDLQWESAGISGDRTQNLLWRLRNYRYNVCTPGCVVIAIGINNLIAGDTPDDTAEGIVGVAEEAEKVFPDSKIILLGVYPAGKDKGSAIREKCDSLHRLLAAHNFARAVYVNPTSWFTDANGNIRDGLYAGDYIHFTPEGYRTATAQILRLTGRAD
ncbi:MAG: hypothetical protein K2H99_08930 [Paramuribaculum sp.]|nr:hypothetical protein [Paramuribaculum sp.]